MPTDAYEDELLASLYDSFYPWGSCDDFYLTKALAIGGDTLDVGCGTGVLACRIASKGLAVTGVDASEAMLRVARLRSGGERVTWIRSEAQHLRLSQQFDFIYMTGHAFQNLLTDSDVLAVFASVAHLLKPNGRFIFESRNPEVRAWLSWTPERSLRTVVSAEHGRVSLFYDAVVDPGGDIVTITENYGLLDRGMARAGTNRIRFTHQEDLTRLLAKTNLAPIEWYGDWDGSQFLPASKEIIIVTQRRN
jgi:SAM-dependent methyltransferase